MDLQPKRTVAAGDSQVWQRVYETSQGGFALNTTGLTTLASTAVLKAGLPVGFDESTRTARVVKIAVLHANAANNATVYQVKKGHNFIIGEHMGATAGSAAYTITAIDTSNADYDAITLGTTLGVALTAGTGLFQSAAAGGSAAAYIVTPKGLLYEDLSPSTDKTVSVVIRGTVYARRIPTVPTAIRALMPLIIFSESY
jgi:hypothetical protein